jgi:hypothetical protein
MIGYKYRAKLVYFDRSIIRRNWSRINEGPYKRAGLLVRRIARGSIRHTVSPRSSPPGKPPRSRHPSRAFKLIFSVPSSRNVIIGMVGFKLSRHPVPGRHEHGDRIHGKVIDRRPRIRARNQFGQFKPRRKLTAKNWYHIKKKKPLVHVRSIHYPPRPFMFPALKKALPRLPSMWLNSVSR